MRTLAISFVVVSTAAAVLCMPVVAQDAPVQFTEGNHRDTDPMISPDGACLAFASNRTGNYDIWIYNFKDREFLQLSRGAKHERYPFFSADSQKLLFTSNQTGKGDIYETAVDGSAGNLQLTTSESLEEYASYRPGGTELLYARAEKRNMVRKKMAIILTAAPGASARVLIDDGDEPRFSPDGQHIVFVSRRTKNKDIWLTGAAGGPLIQLTTSEKDDENPCFSPDGKSILFASNRTGNFDLYVMDADGRNLRQLTSDAADERQPCWTPDGNIYYTREMNLLVSNIWRIPAPK